MSPYFYTTQAPLSARLLLSFTLLCPHIISAKSFPPLYVVNLLSRPARDTCCNSHGWLVDNLSGASELRLFNKIMTTKRVNGHQAVRKEWYNLLCIDLWPRVFLVQIKKKYFHGPHSECTLFCPVPDLHTDFVLKF